MKITEKAKVEITVKRPNGKIETLIHPNIDYMTDGLLAQMRKAMTDAGRGDVLSYRNIDAVVEMEEVDYIVKCDRCGSQVDTRTAYRQVESDGAHKVIAHYCDSCVQLLHAVGAGEYTAMQDRRVGDVDNTPHTKQD